MISEISFHELTMGSKSGWSGQARPWREADYASTYSAMLVGDGTAIPSSFKPSM